MNDSNSLRYVQKSQLPIQLFQFIFNNCHQKLFPYFFFHCIYLIFCDYLSSNCFTVFLMMSILFSINEIYLPIQPKEKNSMITFWNCVMWVLCYVFYYAEHIYNIWLRRATTILNSLPLYLVVVGIRTRNIAVLVRIRILYTTNLWSF